jgi:hypothetical protein
MRRTFFGALLSLAVLSNSARAQGNPSDPNATRRVSFGIGGGAIVPRTNARAQDVLAGAIGQAFMQVRIAPGFPALRFGADFSRMKFGDVQQGTSGVPDGATRSQLAGLASMRFDLIRGPIRPYVVAGVGAFNIRDALAASIAGGSTTTLTSTEFGVDGGAGLSFRMGRISGFLETRLQNVYTKQQGLIDTKSISAFPVTFGLMF